MSRVSKSNELLRFSERGIYCPPADVYIDPWRPVDRAIITHGHSDHARAGHGHYLAHRFTTEIMKHRLGEGLSYQSVDYGDSVNINGVTFTFIPAGHILGSCQLRIEYKGHVGVVSGDYKLEDDGISGCYEPIPCHTLITECTFGLPLFNWKEDHLVKEEFNTWVKENALSGKNSVLLGYSLGKAQRLQHMLETDLPIYVHGAVHHMNAIYEHCGISLPPTIYPQDTKKPEGPCVVIAPPSVLGTPWLRKFAPFASSMASGWMSLRGPRRRRSVDKGFVLSDHMDWKGLHTVMDETRPERVICTHGYTDIFAQYLREQGIEAITEKTEFETEQTE
jgi:putative mRNA 3-end processing factor